MNSLSQARRTKAERKRRRPPSPPPQADIVSSAPIAAEEEEENDSPIAPIASRKRPSSELAPSLANSGGRSAASNQAPSAVPSVHHLTEQTKPSHTRRTLTVQDVFKPPLSHFWPPKFSAFNLLMIDEVHHLGDKSSGSTLEAVLCRMMKTQRVAVGDGNGDEAGFRSDMRSDMRIVAVSATLPNIADIATFIEAEGHAYSFDSSYRAVPIEVHFSDQGSVETNQFMFDRGLSKDVPDILEEFSNDLPSIVFCHIRKDTEHLAESLARKYGTEQHKAELSEIALGTKVMALRKCLLSGIAYHHAGMEVQDRHLVEKAFSGGHLRCICATSTLAMGVNLPAHLVVIKGTTLYDPQRGGFRDLGVLDVQQIFGRAGRPGFDTSGEGVIVTEHKKLAHYLGSVSYTHLTLPTILLV